MQVSQYASFGNVSLEIETQILRVGTRSARLNNKQTRMMALFLSEPGTLFSTERLLQQLWEWPSSVEVNVVWTNISALRRVLRDLGANIRIRSRRSVGYSLILEE